MKKHLLFRASAVKALCVVVGLLLGLTLSVYGNEAAYLGDASLLKLKDAHITINPMLYYTGWIARRPVGGWKPEKDNRRHWQMLDRDSKATAVEGWSGYTLVGKDTLDITYCWQKQKELPLIYTCASISLPLATYAGGRVCADGKVIALPREWHDQMTLWGGKATNLVFCSAAGEMLFRLELPAATYSCHLQDNRRWQGKDFTLRLISPNVKKAAVGTQVRASFRLITPTPLTFSAQAHTIRAGADWIPMTSDWRIIPGSALDFSKFRGTEAPAGKYGYPVCRNGHFEFERLPGVPQRFYGCNIVSSANFPEESTVNDFAANFARIGYNAMRFHHHDGGFSAGPNGQLNAENMRKFDALYAACRAQGIYMTTDLYVSRRPLWRDIGVDKDGRCIDIGFYKALVHFNEKAFEDLINYARAFLNHVNAHTALRYADDPALGWLSLVNEGNLGGGCAGGIDALKEIPECVAAWREYRARLIKADPAFVGIAEGIPSNLWKKKDNRTEIAFLRFLSEREQRFARRLKKFLREEMKCRALMTDMNVGFDTALYEVVRHEEYDYVDNHFYVDHPHFLEKRWRLPSRCPNENPFLNRERGARPIFASRIFGKPFTITEYNYSGPGRFRGVGGIATAALAALQDWDGLWRFAWSHQVVGMTGEKPMTYFDVAGDPLALASERASVCLFLRRDLEALKDNYALLLPPAQVRTQREGPPVDRVPWSWCAWYAKSGSLMADAAPQGWRTAGTFPGFTEKSDEEVAADLKGLPCGGGALNVTPDGRFILQTPRTAGGFAEEGVIEAGPFRARLKGAAATIWASALDDKPLRESAHLLVSHLTDVQNTGISYADITLKVLMGWGTLPHLMRNGKAEVTLNCAPGNWKVYALESTGKRRGCVTASVVNGALTFVADVARDATAATYLYELVRE